MKYNSDIDIYFIKDRLVFQSILNKCYDDFQSKQVIA